MNTVKGIVPVIVMLYVLGAGVVGYAGLKVFSPATHKKEIAAADAQAQRIAADAAEQQTKLLADIKANKEAIAAAQAELAANKLVAQDAAGFVTGASMALAGEESPSVGVKIASTLTADAVRTLPPATSAQLIAFTKIVADMRADNARLSAALIVKEREAAEARAAATKSEQVAKLATEQAILADTEAKQSSAALKTEAASHAKAVKALDDKVSDGVSFLDRLKLLGIGSGVLMFILLPLTALAFPEVAPLIRIISAPFLKLWHMIHEREKEIVARMHDEAQDELSAIHAKLTGELAAHSETKAMLVKVATSP